MAVEGARRSYQIHHGNGQISPSLFRSRSPPRLAITARTSSRRRHDLCPWKSTGGRTRVLDRVALTASIALGRNAPPRPSLPRQPPEVGPAADDPLGPLASASPAKPITEPTQVPLKSESYRCVRIRSTMLDCLLHGFVLLPSGILASKTDAAAGYDYAPEDQAFAAEQQDTIPRSDDGAQEMEYAGDDYYTTDGAYYYVENVDAQE